MSIVTKESNPELYNALFPKDEIKEILEYVLSLTYGNESAIKGIDKVKDYITNLDKKYKKSCETYQQALDETMSEKMDLEDKIKKANDYIDKHTIEWKDDKFEDNNIMVKFNEYSNPQELKNILGGDDNAINSK